MPHFVCYAHNSNKKLYNLEDKNKNITIPNQISFYDYKSGRFILARAIILPKEIINYNYSILDNKVDDNNKATRLWLTNEGDVYIHIEYNRPIFLGKIF